MILKIVDRSLAIILLLGAAGHTMGSVKAYENEPITLLWSLCASLLVMLLGALHLLRTNRTADRALAWITGFGTACWLCASIAFGFITGNVLDPRVIVFVLVSAGLILFCLKSIVGASRGEGR